MIFGIQTQNCREKDAEIAEWKERWTQIAEWAARNLNDCWHGDQLIETMKELEK